MLLFFCSFFLNIHFALPFVPMNLTRPSKESFLNLKYLFGGRVSMCALNLSKISFFFFIFCHIRSTVWAAYTISFLTGYWTGFLELLVTSLILYIHNLIHSCYDSCGVGGDLFTGFLNFFFCKKFFTDEIEFQKFISPYKVVCIYYS